jgi:hypothetical protein
MSKYMQQFNTLNSFKDYYVGFFGIKIFLSDDKQIKAMDRFRQLLKENI